MYRAFVYFGVPNFRLSSQGTDRAEEAVDLLNKLLDLPGFAGGGIERHVDGIGWVIFE